MVNNRQRKAIRKSQASAEDQAQHDRIKNLLNTLAPLDDAANPSSQDSNTASGPSTSNNSRKRRISAVRRRPFNWRPKRKAKASAVRANNNDSEVVANPSSQPSTSGSSSNGPSDRQAQNNNPPGIVTQQPVQIDNPTAKRSVKTRKPIKKEPENINPEQMDAEFEYVNMDIAMHDSSNRQEERPDPEAGAPESQQPAHEGPEANSEMTVAVSTVQSHPPALIVAPAKSSAKDVAAPKASEVIVGIPPFVSEAVALPEPLVVSTQQPRQDQGTVPATPTPVDQVAVTPVVRLDRPQCPEYLNTERAALIRLSGRPNDFRTWNAQDVHDWLGMLPNQSAAFKALREKLLAFDGSGDFLNQLLSGPESVKSASEMLNASILHCHSIKRHVAALENFLLEAEYKEAMQKYEKQNN